MSVKFKSLYREDQRVLRQWITEWNDKHFRERNQKLRLETERLLRQQSAKEPVDYFYAAMIFQHGFTIGASRKALRYARKAVDKGYSRGKWLVAAATDRLLQLQGKPQQFGTQVVDQKAKKLKMYHVEKSTTDEERKLYGLPSLDALRRRLKL